MPDSYSVTGQEVLFEGKHFADAVNPEVATNIAAVLNAYVQISLISFGEAERVGNRLHDHWEKMAGEAPMSRNDTGWGDVVQQTLRFVRDAVAEREVTRGR